MMDLSKMMETILNEESNEKKMSEKQKKVVVAAIEMFAEKGYAATSTSEIAKRAGVAEGTIFRHYKTKKDLLLSIVMPTIVNYLAPFYAKNFVNEVFNDKHATFETFLRTLIQNRYEFAKQNFPSLRIFMQEILYQQELREVFVTQFQKLIYPKFTVIINHFQEKGEIVDLPPNTVIRYLVSNVIGLMVHRFIISPSDEWDDETEIEQTIQFIMKGLKRE